MKVGNFASILAVSLALSAYSAWLLPARDQPTAVEEMDHCASAAGIDMLSQAEAEALWHRPSAVFVDVRSAGDYEFGHIQGAVSLPEEEFDRRFPELKARLEGMRHIVLYCKSTDCAKSLRVALRLHKVGLSQAKIYQNGWNDWYLSGLPISRGRP